MTKEKGSKMEAGAGAQPLLSDEELVEKLERLKVSMQWAGSVPGFCSLCGLGRSRNGGASP